MNTAKWRQLSDQELCDIIAASKSYREVTARLGLSTKSSQSQAAVKKMIQEKGFDIQHFLHQGCNKNNFDFSRFTNNTPLKGANSIKALMYLKGNVCEICGLSEWLGKPLRLEVHHIDRDHYNNELSNLQLLCPNCHSQTDNYCGKNINRDSPNVTEEELLDSLLKHDSIRQALIHVGLTGAWKNYDRAHDLIVKYQIANTLEHQNRKLSV